MGSRLAVLWVSHAVLFAVGFADSSAAATPNTTPNTIEVMYTIKGDATLDGRVNLSDLNALGANVNASPASWNQGNFNYDAFVNLTDLNILGSNVNQVLPAGGPAVTQATVPTFPNVSSAGGASATASSDLPMDPPGNVRKHGKPGKLGRRR